MSVMKFASTALIVCLVSQGALSAPILYKKMKPSASVSGAVGISTSRPVHNQGNGMSTMRADLGVDWNDRYSLSAKAVYRRPHTEHDPNYDGFGDVGIYLSDEAIYKNTSSALTLSGSLGYELPVSKGSKSDSMEQGVSAGLSLKKDFPVLSIVLGTEVGRYFYTYDTTESDSYNTPYVWANSIALIKGFGKSVITSLSGVVLSTQDYGEGVYNSYKIEAGAAWSFMKSMSLSAVAATAQSNSEQGRGPQLFHAKSSVVSIGLKYRF